MRLTLFALLSFLFAATALAQDISRDLETFTGLNVNAGIKTTVVQGNRYHVDVTGDAEALKELKIEVKGGTLSLGYESNAWKRTSSRKMNTVRATVYVPMLKSVMVNGGAQIDSKDTWKGSAMKVTGNGGGGVDLKLAVDKAEITVNGGSQLELSGTAGDVEASANGGGRISASNLVAKTVRASANGGGVIRVEATDAITANANGGGQIVYTGSATKVNKSTNGGGRVSKG